MFAGLRCASLHNYTIHQLNQESTPVCGKVVRNVDFEAKIALKNRVAWNYAVSLGAEGANNLLAAGRLDRSALARGLGLAGRSRIALALGAPLVAVAAIGCASAYWHGYP